MSPRVWTTSHDETIEYVSLTSDKLEGGMTVLREGFFPYENFCKGVELPQHPEAVVELEGLCIRTAKDGISIIAVDKKSGKVAGVAFNKLQVKNDGDQLNYFTQYAANCKHPSSKALVQLMSDADEAVNLFDLCKTSCLLEIMTVGVLPEFRGKGIATKLCEVSLELGKALMAGENVKTPLDDEPLPNEPVPTVATSIFSTHITQRIGKNLGFVIANELSYDKFMFAGKSFASRIGPDTPFATVEYKFL